MTTFPIPDAGPPPASDLPRATNALIRAYKYRAFPPTAGVADFEAALRLKRELWRALIAIDGEYRDRKTAIMAAPEIEAAKQARAAATDKAARKAAAEALAAARKARAEAVKPQLLALGAWRVDREREAKQAIAAKGLHWGDYNAVVNQFHGAAQAAKARGAAVYNFEQACGEACVNQIMPPRPSAALPSHAPTLLAFTPHAGARRRPGSHRAAYSTGRLSMTVRGARNPLGEARLALEFVMHRPPPPDGVVTEVRVTRRWRPVVNREGVVRQRPEWSVILVMRLPAPPLRTAGAAGLAFTWRAVDDDDDLQPFAVLADARGVRPLALPYGHADDWDIRAGKFAAADAAEGAERETLLAEARIFARRLDRRRLAAHRDLAALLARDHAVIAVQKIDLSGKGMKAHAGHAALRLALRHAVENAGGRLIEVAVARPADAADPAAALAKILLRAAREEAASAVFSKADGGIVEGEQCDAA